MIGRWRRRRAQDQQAMLISDIDRTRLYMRAVISRARSLGQPVPAMIVISVTAWGEWLDNLTEQ